MLEIPNRGDGEFKRVAVRIAEVNRRGIVAEGEFPLDCDAMLAEALAPCGKFARLDSKRGMSGASGPMSGKRASDAGHFCAKEKQDARAVAHLKGGTATVREECVGNLAEAENIFVERECTFEIRDVERGLENAVQSWRH